MGPFALALLILLQQPAGSAPAAPAGASATQSPQDQGLNANDLPVSIDRIERALAAPPPISLKEQHPVLRLEVFGRKPTLEDILGEKFWLGPAPYGGMTHQEFMNMVTPKEFRPYAGFTGGYLVAETALTLAETWALKSAIRKYQEAKEDREREAARKEVLDALAQLEKARRAAGLVDK